MKLTNIITSSLFQILSLIFVCGYLLGVLNVHFSDKNDYCEMTYMFEYPQFVRITVPENSIYPQYGLYAYSEGRFTERARKMWFDGVPVLFLPGNSGSHMQARSLSSVALRKALSNGYDYHFDFFTISYNEELSGLYGGVLESQTKFAAASVARILSLYKSNKYTKFVPNSVILIGHSMENIVKKPAYAKEEILVSTNQHVARVVDYNAHTSFLRPMPYSGTYDDDSPLCTVCNKGGLIAKRLLAYPSTINTTNLAITLAAPLEAPVINFDATMNNYYMLMDLEWETNVHKIEEIKEKKLLLSFGNGPRDILMPSGLTSTNDSFIDALTTSIPGVWVSPDHVGIVWCKQLVMTLNRYLFDIVDPWTEQLSDNKQLLMSKAKQYFQANRSMTLSPEITRTNVTMLADAFWYEDNRRIYQIIRPEIEKMTYLMIRLVDYPQNRFVAVEAVNVDDKDWIFGCNAKFIYNTYRYCKQATSLSELSRWTGAAADSGRRKLATLDLHSIKELHPDWSHVIVKVSPTRKPIVLNVDINDLASRQITVKLPSSFTFTKTVIKQETERNSLYYELILPDFKMLYQAYLLYVEPTANCKAAQYHVSAEVYVPWAANHEYYHYFTPLKRSPMKLRLYKSSPNDTTGLGPAAHVKVTLLLDPQCTYTISITSSWYHQLAQLARNYSSVLIPYMAAIVLLAARSNLLSLWKQGTCMSLHGALMSECVKPYYALVFARVGAQALLSLPFLVFLFENASWKNQELHNFTRSLLVLPAYMTALGLLNIAAAAVLIMMVFSSQLAHRLLFRIMWRGGSGLAEKVATGLQKVPMLVSAALVFAAPLSCGAASLIAGAAFYAFMLSKMYEEYLEDYVYKLMAKVASRMCRLFRSNRKRKLSETDLVVKDNTAANLTVTQALAIENKEVVGEDKGESNNKIVSKNEKNVDLIRNDLSNSDNKNCDAVLQTEESKDVAGTEENCDGSKDVKKRRDSKDIDEDLNNLNFHMMLFFMWMAVTLVNVPALLTWARNFKYSMVLKPDTSYHTGLAMSACSTCVWQLKGPRRNLRFYEEVSATLFTMAIFILILGPLCLTVVNYGVTAMFIIITIQQVCDKEEIVENSSEENQSPENSEKNDNNQTSEPTASSSGQSQNDNDNKQDTDNSEPSVDKTEDKTEETSEDCVCNEGRIYRVFKNLRDKFSFTED